MPHKNKFDPATERSAKAFGASVKEARRQLGLTQSELGKIVGGHGTNIKQIENEGCSPKAKYFFALCDELGLDPYDFGFVGKYKGIIDEWTDDESR